MSNRVVSTHYSRAVAVSRTPSRSTGIERWWVWRPGPNLALAWCACRDAEATSRNVFFCLLTAMQTRSPAHSSNDRHSAAREALAFLSLFRPWRGVGDLAHCGLRRLLQAGYVVAGVLSICALAFGTPWLGAILLMLVALGTEAIDGARNLLFLRAVHPYERPEMTTVFVSFRDVARLGPPTVFSLLLSLFSLPSVFVTGGLMMLAASSLSRRIPRSL